MLVERLGTDAFFVVATGAGAVCEGIISWWHRGYRTVGAAFDMLLSGAMNHRGHIILENQIKN